MPRKTFKHHARESKLPIYITPFELSLHSVEKFTSRRLEDDAEGEVMIGGWGVLHNDDDSIYKVGIHSAFGVIKS